MSYFSNAEDQSLHGSLGCGSSCNCGPCKSGVGGLDEWYVKADEPEPAQVAPPKSPAPSPLPAAAPPRVKSRKAPTGPGVGLAYYGLPMTAHRFHGLAEPRGPLPQPVLPPVRPVPMPTNPLVPKQWCSPLNKIQSNICFSYGPQEIANSRTEAGLLTPDVVLVQPGVIPQHSVVSCQYLIIRDFGVDWRHIKRAALNEQLLKDSLNRFETDKSLTFRIVGYNDCVGVERNNFLLRRGRARNVFKLFGPGARSRVISVVASPPGTFLTENSTIPARANNRAVVIEIFLNSTQTI